MNEKVILKKVDEQQEKELFDKLNKPKTLTLKPKPAINPSSPYLERNIMGTLQTCYNVVAKVNEGKGLTPIQINDQAKTLLNHFWETMEEKVAAMRKR